jgi:predicted TIM-barrel enzyme
MGQLRPDPGAAFSYRHSIGADDIAVLTNLTPEFASPLGTRTVADRAQGARFFGCEAALISGPRAGSAFRFADLEEAKAACPDLPVLANTGVRHDTAERILETADGIIVGTSLKVDGKTSNRIDLDRARRMVQLTRVAREHHLERVAEARA